MEKELKLKILNKDDYLKIAKTVQDKYDAAISLQKNFYYDTENMMLLKNKSILRARIEKDKVIITFKKQKEVKDGYFISEEIEETAQIGELEMVLSGEKYILDLCSDCKKIIEDLINNEKLVLVGKMKTERTYFYYDGIKFELDKVNFGDDTFDYEIEVESENMEEANKKLKGFLQKLKIKFKVQEKTKFQRLLILKKK